MKYEVKAGTLNKIRRLEDGWVLQVDKDIESLDEKTCEALFSNIPLSSAKADKDEISKLMGW